MPRLPNSCVFQALLLCCIAAAAFCAIPAHGADARGKRAADFRESMFLDVDSAAVKKLRAAEDHLKVEQWAEAIDILRQTVDAHGDKLVPAAPHRYVNVRTYADMLVSGLPAAGLRIYRERADPAVKKLFETGKAERDEDLLQRVLRQGFASSYGDDALLLLGDLAWEHGALSAARGYWEKILTPKQYFPPGHPLSSLAYPDTDVDLASVRARLVLCSLVQGNRRRAEWELARFTELHPQAEGSLAGQAGNLVKTLQSVATQAAGWDAAPASTADATFAFSPERNKVLPREVEIGSEQWHVPLKEIHPNVIWRPSALPQEGALSYFPVIWENVVLVNDDDSVFAYQLANGKPWPDENAENAILYPSGVAGIPEAAGRLFREDSARTLGIPRFTLTVHEGRLYVRLGSIGGLNLGGEAAGRLVCLDLERGEGKLIWETKAAEIDADAGQWWFEGSPIVAGGDLFVGLRKQGPQHPQPQSNVACFNAETGKLRWNRKICMASANPAVEHRELSQQLVTLAENTLYYSTNLGAIAALDSRDGALRWVATYQRRDEDDQPALLAHLRTGLNPCVFHEGTIFAAPADCNRLLALDAETGILKWERGFSKPVQCILGVGRGNLIVAADKLTAFDAETGRRVWEDGSENDPETYTYGRGLLAGEVVYWPQREQIVIVDQRTGVRTRDPSNLETKQVTGGNLAIANGFLLIAQPNRLSVFGEHSRAIKPLQDDIAAQNRRPGAGHTSRTMRLR